MASLRLVLPLAAWGGAMYGVLQIRRLTGSWDHIICGPWGCGPPLSSLLAYHGFWFVVLGGVALLAVRTWPPRVLRYVGFGLVVGALAALVALIGWDLVSWLPQVADAAQKNVVQRSLFVVLTAVDVPAIPILLAGVLCIAAGRREAP